MPTRFSKAFAGLRSSLPNRQYSALLIAISTICIVAPLVLLVWLHQKTEEFSHDRPTSPEQPLLNGRYRALSEYHSTATLIGWTTASVGLLSCLTTLYVLHRLHREVHHQTVQLQESQSLIEAIESSITDSLFTLNSQGQIETFNPAAIGMFGYDPSEIIGKDLNLLLDQANYAKTAESHEINTGDLRASALSTTITDASNPSDNADRLGDMSTSPRSQRGIAHRKIGAPFPIELSIGNALTHKRRVAIVRDVSRQEQTEAELQSRVAELNQLAAELTQTRVDLQTVYMTCHDLTSPLQAIAHLSEWIEADLTERVRADTQNQINLLRERVQRMEGLVETILKSAPPQA